MRKVYVAALPRWHIFSLRHRQTCSCLLALMPDLTHLLSVVLLLQNVLLDRHGRCKIADLGLSRSVGGASRGT